MASTSKIIIIGGGIGGLGAALALLKRGLDVEIYEQSPELREVGAGVQMGPNGTRVLHALGLDERAQAHPVAPARRDIRHVEHRRDLELVRSRRQGDRAPRHAAPDAAPRRPARRAGRRGARRSSRTRCISAGAAPASPRRATQSRSTSTTARRSRAAHRDRRRRHPLQGARQPVRRRTSRSSPASSPGAAWCRSRSCRRTVSRTCRHQLARAARPCAALSGAARRIDEFRRLRRARRLAGGILDLRGTTRRTRQRFPRLARRRAGDHPQHRRALQMGADGAPPMRALERQGRITLLGDACHPTLPFLGQGGVMAIEDGYVARRLPAKYLRRPCHRLRALRGRAARSAPPRSCARRPRTAARRSARLADRDAVALSVAQEWQQERVRERMEWLYAYDATAVAV